MAKCCAVEKQDTKRLQRGLNRPANGARAPSGPSEHEPGPCCRRCPPCGVQGTIPASRGQTTSVYCTAAAVNAVTQYICSPSSGSRPGWSSQGASRPWSQTYIARPTQRPAMHFSRGQLHMRWRGAADGSPSDWRFRRGLVAGEVHIDSLSRQFGVQSGRPGFKTSLADVCHF